MKQLNKLPHFELLPTEKLVKIPPARVEAEVSGIRTDLSGDELNEQRQLKEYGFVIPVDGSLEEYNDLLNKARTLPDFYPNLGLRQRAIVEIKRACVESPQNKEMIRYLERLDDYEKLLTIEKKVRAYENRVIDTPNSYVPWEITKAVGDAKVRFKNKKAE